MDAIKMQPVNSSMFSETGYRMEDWALCLRFKSNGSLITYHNVPPEVADEFLESESLGKFYTKNIKGNKAYKVTTIDDLQKVDSPPKQEDPNGLTEEDLNHIWPGSKVIEAEHAALQAAEQASGATPLPEGNGSRTIDGIDQMRASVGLYDEPAKPVEQTVVVDRIVDLTAEAAIELPEKKAPEIKSIVEQAAKHAEEGLKIKVNDGISYAAAGQTLKVLVSARERAFNFLDPIRDAIYKAYQVAMGKQKLALDPIDKSIEYVKLQMKNYENLQRDLKEQKQREANEAAERRAREQQQHASQQLTMAEVGSALARGDDKRAEELIQKPIEAPLPYVAPEQVHVDLPEVEGIGGRKNWKVKDKEGEYDLIAFLTAVKAGSYPIDKAAQLIKPNFPSLNKMAKGLEMAFDVPGFKAWNDSVITTKK